MVNSGLILLPGKLIGLLVYVYNMLQFSYVSHFHFLQFSDSLSSKTLITRTNATKPACLQMLRFVILIYLLFYTRNAKLPN